MSDTNNETMRGKISQAWVFRCLSCHISRTIESTSGRVTQGLAIRWAREAGWSLTKKGWKCRECKP